MFETFEHTADLGVRVRAASLPQVFAEAARGLFAVLIANPAAVVPRFAETVAIAGTQPELLLQDWLSELLFRFESRRFALARCDVSVGAAGMEARIEGETIDPARHSLAHEVKAITYHGLQVVPESDGWLAEFILDI